MWIASGAMSRARRSSRDRPQHRRRTRRCSSRRLERAAQSRPHGVDRHPAARDRRRAGSPSPPARRNTTRRATARASRAALDDVAIDQQPARARAVREHDRLVPSAGVRPSRNAVNAVMPVPPANSTTSVAAVDDEVAVRHLDPDLPALDELALHARREPPVHRVRDPQRVALAPASWRSRTRATPARSRSVVRIERQVQELPGRNRGTGSFGPQRHRVDALAVSDDRARPRQRELLRDRHAVTRPRRRRARRA